MPAPCGARAITFKAIAAFSTVNSDGAPIVGPGAGAGLGDGVGSGVGWLVSGASSPATGAFSVGSFPDMDAFGFVTGA